MKKLLLISILLTLRIITNSQELVEETKVWNNVECMNSGPCWTYTYKVIGDTTINLIEYKKLYIINDSLKSGRGLYGALREDGKRVFLLNFFYGTEAILYDFNLAVGDQFITTSSSNDCFGYPIELEVITIDTVSLLNGEQRRRFNLGWGEIWIESIGSLNGINNVGIYQCGADMFYDLSCCHLYGEKIFQSTEFDHCYVNTVGYVEISKKTKPVIYPNPFSEFTTFEFDYSSSHVYRLQIINGLGQLIQTIESINSSKIIIERNQLNKGIHFYKLFKENEEIVTGIFVVK